MKKFLYIISCIVLLFSLTACGESMAMEQQPPKERPHLYWKEIEVEVVNIDKRHWFAGTHHYVVDVTVYSEEYNLTKSFTYQAGEAFAVIPCWNYQKGDIIKAELYSWVMDSTGEIVKRDINKVY